jgi:hypothetical protein
MSVPGHPVGAQALFATFAKAAADELARQSRIVADPAFYGRDAGSGAGASPGGGSSGQKAGQVRGETEDVAARLDYQGEAADDLSFTEEEGRQLPLSSSSPSAAETGAQAQVAPVTLFGDDTNNIEAGADIVYHGSDDDDGEEQKQGGEGERFEVDDDGEEEEEEEGRTAVAAEVPRHLTPLDVSPISLNPQSPRIAPSTETDGRPPRALSPSMRVLHPSSRNAAFETMSPSQKRQMHLLNMIADLRNRSAVMS